MVNVMLIDDHPVVRAGLRAILNAFPDIEVVLEGSDGSAVEQLTDADAPHIDVVVCDIQMPDVDGIAATRRVRELDGPPVLILTTYDTQADILAAVEAGALGYLLKDAPEETLHTAVLDTAAGKRTLAPEVTNLLAERLAQPETALSPRELEILQALSTGDSNKQIAQRLFISEATVKTHLIHVYQKLGVETRTAAVSAARERKLIQ
ncbi:MAG: response regulator [Corynebacterium aurimucosum]